MAKEWWCLVPVWSEADSHSYRLNEDQGRRRQTEQGTTDLAVTDHSPRFAAIWLSNNKVITCPKPIFLIISVLPVAKADRMDPYTRYHPSKCLRRFYAVCAIET